MTKVKQKKIVVKKIEWLEVSFHLDEGKPEQCKENNLSGEFPRFCEKIPITGILITPRMEELSGAWDYGVWLEKYLLGPILEFPRWDISNFRARRYLAILGHPHRLTEFTFGNKKFNIWYHLAIVVQIDQDLVF